MRLLYRLINPSIGDLETDTLKHSNSPKVITTAQLHNEHNYFNSAIMHHLFNTSFIFLTALSAGIHASPTRTIPNLVSKVLAARDTYVSQIPSTEIMVSLYSDVFCTLKDIVAYAPLIYNETLQQFHHKPSSSAADYRKASRSMSAPRTVPSTLAVLSKIRAVGFFP